jgi:hypothetical protein
MAVGLYQAELAHPDIRGTIVALQQFMLGIGALVSCEPARNYKFQG